MLETRRNPILNPARTIAAAEQEMQKLPHLNADRRHVQKSTRRTFRDARKAASATLAIAPLPQPDEALHLAISGRFALWHIVPAVASLAAQRITELRIATLGFSRQNIDELAGMLDTREIDRAWLLCSHYFKSTSAEIYDHAQAEFEKRPGRATFASIRTHAKLLLIKLADGRVFTVESSANLRSCKNIEQMTIIASPDVYAFHAGWVDEIFTAAASAEKP